MSGEEGTGMVPVVGAAARARRGPARGGWRLAAGEHSVPRPGGARPAPPPPHSLPTQVSQIPTLTLLFVSDY